MTPSTRRECRRCSDALPPAASPHAWYCAGCRRQLDAAKYRRKYLAAAKRRAAERAEIRRVRYLSRKCRKCGEPVELEAHGAVRYCRQCRVGRYVTHAPAPPRGRRAERLRRCPRCGDVKLLAPRRRACDDCVLAAAAARARRGRLRRQTLPSQEGSA